MMRGRFVLCRPQGGLNDTLCQIEKSISYAEATERIVLIDTSYVEPGAGYIKDKFSNYFDCSDPRIRLNSDQMRDDLNALTVFPDFIVNNVDGYKAYYDPKAGNFVERKTKKLISFDFSKDYSEDLVVHHACGGGNLGIYALNRLCLKHNISNELFARISQIKNGYTAIHIRNTDYKSDYKSKRCRDHTRQALWVMRSRD